MSYYSNEGQNIYQGAAGYGKLRAYKDGSLGCARPRGAAGEYFSGAGGGGVLQAYQDGSLGDPGMLRAFQDGSLGGPLFLEDESGVRQLETPVTITHAPMGEYFTGPGGGGPLSPYRNGVLGAVEMGGPTLDLNNPAVMKELKIAMGAVIAGTSYINEFPLEFYEDPSWGSEGTKLATYWWGAAVNITVLALATTKGAALSSEEVGQVTDQIGKGLVEPARYPNALGVVNVVSLAGAAGVPVPPDKIPLLTAFATAAKAAAGPDGAPRGDVIPPGGGGFLKSNAAAFGLAAVALVGIALVFRKKR